VAEQAANARLADDVLARFEGIVGFDPLPKERVIADALMRA
jgi:hypothetical protein